MQNHFFQEDLAGIFHAHSYHGQAITDEDNLNSCGVGDMAAGEVMGREHGYRFTLFIQGTEGVESDFLSQICAIDSDRRMRTMSALKL